MKILIDMNLTPEWVELLQGAGLEAVHWSGVGPGAAPDREIMLYARENGFTVLTRDLDFGTLLAQGGHTQPGVVQIRSAHAGPAALGELVVRSISQMRDELEAGALLTVDPKRTRLRILPMLPRE